jgi:hypothetical protein
MWSHHCIPIPIPFVIAAFALLLGMVGVVCCSSSLGVEPVDGRVISFVENEKETKKKNAPGGLGGYLLAPSPLIVISFHPPSSSLCPHSIVIQHCWPHFFGGAS